MSMLARNIRPITLFHMRHFNIMMAFQPLFFLVNLPNAIPFCVGIRLILGRRNRRVPKSRFRPRPRRLVLKQRHRLVQTRPVRKVRRRARDDVLIRAGRDQIIGERLAVVMEVAPRDHRAAGGKATLGRRA